jgi:hypothetical protein
MGRTIVVAFHCRSSVREPNPCTRATPARRARPRRSILSGFAATQTALFRSASCFAHGPADTSCVGVRDIAHPCAVDRSVRGNYLSRRIGRGSDPPGLRLMLLPEATCSGSTDLLMAIALTPIHICSHDFIRSSLSRLARAIFGSTGPEVCARVCRILRTI